MQSNNAQLKLSDDHQMEYQKQQECPKAMAATSEKIEVSADMMIKNLLKSSFKKSPKIPTCVEQLDHSYAELPPWLQCNSAAVPAQYRYLWSLVQSTMDLADTQKVSQLLLTSGLQVDMLGFIWSLANKAIPGQLTKQEFYIVLALVSLVQSGYTFNNLNILKLLTVPSMPILQLGLLKFPVPQFNTSQKAESTSFNSIREFPNLHPKPPLVLKENENRDGFISCGINDKILVNNSMKNVISQKESNEANFTVATGSNKTPKPSVIEPAKDPYKNSNFPCIGLSPTAELEDDFSAFQSVSTEKDDTCTKVSQTIHDSCDEFSEFQSANIEQVDPFETVVISQKREIPKIPLPKTLTGKFTGMKSSILKISPESGKKLKVLSAAESLSSLPESKISSSNKVSTCIPILGSNHGIGSRLANHSLSSQFEVPQQATAKCHKHHKIKINPISPPSEVILGVKTKNLETVIPKCCPKNSKAYRTFVLKDTKIRNDDAGESCDNEQLGNELDSSGLHSGEQTRQIEIPMLGTFNETVLPTQSKPQISTVDLITVQEDKYSALRQIELELNREKNSDVKEINDDFGDFLSADISDLVTSEAPQSSVEASVSNSDLLLFKKDDEGNWGDWNFNAETSLNLSNSSKTPPMNDFVGVGSDALFSAENDLFGPLNLLTLNDNVKETTQSNSFLSVQQDYFAEDSKSGGVDDAVIFTEKNEKLNDLSSQSKENQIIINELDDEFWSFLSSDSKPSTGNTSSRHDSLPQLDLKTLPTDDCEQEIIWNKCIDSCYSLIQKGFDIFNNVVTKSVLDEVFAAPETENYLNNLNIVCQISKRVSQNFNAFSSAQNELEKLWGRLQELCFEYNIKLKPDEDNFSEGKFRCGICFMYVGQEVVNQGNSCYHPSCANLWINYIEGILPSSV